MTNQRPIDPRWIEWAEQETIRRLRGEPEARGPEPEVPSLEPAAEAVPDDLRIVDEIRLDRDVPEETDADEVRLATRADGLVIRLHRSNVRG